MSALVRYHPLIALSTILFAGFIGFLDYVTVIDIAIVYILPVGLAAWYVGRWAGVLASLVSSGIWLYDDLVTGFPPYANPFVLYWAAAIRFVFYLVISFILAMLHEALVTEKKLSRTDNTTQIANKKHFFDFVTFEIRKARRYRHPFSLAFMDVDNFKTVNDQWGHHQGDALLKTIAETMKENLRDTDLVARVGGDEFAILLPETNAASANEAIHKMKECLTTAARTSECPVTFSFGVVTFLAPPASVDDALKLADDAMYTVKRKGKNMIQHEIFGSSEDTAPAR